MQSEAQPQAFRAAAPSRLTAAGHRPVTAENNKDGRLPNKALRHRKQGPLGLGRCGPKLPKLLHLTSSPHSPALTHGGNAGGRPNFRITVPAPSPSTEI